MFDLQEGVIHPQEGLFDLQEGVIHPQEGFPARRKGVRPAGKGDLPAGRLSGLQERVFAPQGTLKSCYYLIPRFLFP